MSMIKQKLTSRKFWIAVSTIVSGLLMMFGFAETSIETISGAILILGGATGYLVAEGVIDAARIKQVVDAVIDVVEVVGDEVSGDGEVQELSDS